MISLCSAWAVSGLLIGYIDGSHDVRVLGWIFLGMAAALWILQSSYRAYVCNANASSLLQATEQRRRDGGAI